ncbi:MAG: nicotinamide riboside transporter PnuC [Bacteroidales bacterium]|jgi:nicotinamide mononucleotide transporter|nr:nicotinamide riboside transporter PnuC [Bacteroidales bacterium]
MNWIYNNWIEIFGAAAGIIYVFLEIRQNILLWPVGIVTSAVYIYVFFTGKIYADMSLQGYYLVISFVGWYWWISGTSLQRSQSTQEHQDRRVEEDVKMEKGGLRVTRINFRTGIILAFVFFLLLSIMWLVLSRLTDSPIPLWDSIITSLSIVATWMLARKIYEHWFLWIVVNILSAGLFLTRGLFPTMILYLVYFIMSFVGLAEWKRIMIKEPA